MTPSLVKKLETINEWLDGPDGSRLWDILTAARGPDSPSETAGNPNSDLYGQRVARKMKTVAVIRAKAFYNAHGSRQRNANHVTLPKDQSSWDHFDKHVERAANALGLKVKYD